MDDAILLCWCLAAACLGWSIGLLIAMWKCGDL